MLAWHGPLKVVSFVVLLLMAAAIIYALGISLEYWRGIGV
jgi:hypothetical protein